MKPKTEIFQRKDRKWSWRVRRGKNTATAGEGFSSKSNALRAMRAFIKSTAQYADDLLGVVPRDPTKPHVVMCVVALLLFPASCRVMPLVVTKPDGTNVASLGATLGVKSGHETAHITMPDGSQINYTVQGHDGTEVPKDYLFFKGAKSMMESAGDMLEGPLDEAAKAINN